MADGNVKLCNGCKYEELEIDDNPCYSCINLWYQDERDIKLTDNFVEKV